MNAAPAPETQADVLGSSAAGPAAVRGGGLRLGGYLAGALASTVSAALLFRHLGVDDTGLYVTALSLVAIVGGISDLGLTAIGVRESSLHPPRERSRLLSDLLGLRVTLTTIGLAIMLVLAVVAYSDMIILGVLLAGIGLLLQTTQDNLAVPLLVGLRLGSVSALDLTRQLLTVLLIIGLVLAGAHLVAFWAVSIPVGLIVLGATARLVRHQRSLIPSFSWSRWRPLLVRILPYSAAVAAATLYFRVAILMVSQLSSARQLGLFGASYRIIEVLTAVPALLAGTALPIFSRAARDDHDRLGYALGRVYEVALIVGTWVALSILIGAPLAIEVIGGSEFADASGVLAIQGVALGATFVSIVWGNGLLSLSMHRQILLLNAGALLASIAMLAVLVPLDGARGAAIGTACGEVGAALAGGFILVRRYPSLRPSHRVVPRVAAGAALGLLPLAVGGIPVIARLLASTVLYGGTLLLTGALPPELRVLLPWARPTEDDADR
jgi:O-antigen/teichoic acid export membrane protein